jgi:hypothetical protein
MGNMNLNSSPRPSASNGSAGNPGGHEDGKLHKEKKRRNFLGIKK